nr:retrovirus-related Pol polyprotein from transposon TNT 1-94 [Tanacetum cinerariifolium]
MAFISSAKNNSEKEDVNTASIPSASTNVSPASVNIGAVSISQDTACAYIALQSSGSQIKFEDITQIDEDDIEEMDLKVECFNCHKMGHFARECRAPRSQDRGRRDNYRQGSKVEEQALKALMAIDGVGWDWSFIENEEEDHALVVDEEAPTEFALMAKTSAESESQRLDKNKEGLGYNVVPPPPSCSSLLSSQEGFVLDRNPSVPETEESPSTISSKPFIKFVKATDPPTVAKSDKKEIVKKPSFKYAELYRKPIKRSNVRGNISYLSDYEPFDGGYVSFGQGGCKITDKGTIKTGKLEFENVYFVKDLKYNLFSVSQICDNKNSVLFTDSECIVLGRDFKLIDDTNVLLRTPRQHNMYSIDLNNIVPHKDLTCLVAKASADECMLWHRRLCHLNFKTMNKLVRHNLVRGLPIKCFENYHNCIACLKGKQHKASCKSKLVNSVTKPLHTLHMDLFGPTFVSSISHEWYCLVVTDDFSRFTWTFFLKTKHETNGILRNFITEIENLKELKVKIIRCDNGGEFRNKEMNDFCSRKGIKREFSNVRTPQRNGVAERRNRTLIEAATTMLADAKLPVTFWAEEVNTACYVQNRVLVNKSQNKTPYELFNGRTPAIGFLKPFGCYVMILNTLDNLGKFEAKGDKGYFIGYSMSSKAFRVFNKRTKRVEENLHVDFLKNKAIKKRTGPNWLFDIDSLTKSINYVPVVVAGTNSTNLSGTKNATSQEWKPQSTASTSNPPDDQMETLTVETPIPTVSSPVPTACFEDSPEPTTTTRIISKRVTIDSHGEEADVEAMQEELLQFKIQNVWSLVDCPKGVRPIRTKWVLKNKKDERGIVIRNKARLVAQGHTQEEGFDYDEVFALVSRIEANILFLAYASFMGFTVYQMDMKSAFLYGT